MSRIAVFGATGLTGGLRLPNIVEGPEKPWRVSADGCGIGLSISAEAAARFLLEQVSSAEYLRSAPSIGH